VRTELQAAVALTPELKTQVAISDTVAAAKTVDKIKLHAFTARNAVNDPVWTLSSTLPWIGPNLSAIAEVARSSDDVATLGLAPVIRVYESLNWSSLLPGSSGADMGPLQAAAPSLTSSAYAVRTSFERLEGIDATPLLPEVAKPLSQAIEELRQVQSALDTAADAANIAPSMLGVNGSKNYLLIIQNNAEARASGGIPGALAILTLERGNLSLGSQSSASELGIFSPAISVDKHQQEIYTSRLGRYMQDVNLTPDFPTAALTAQAMWKERTGQKVDGVISIDPVVLSYVLQATGPVDVKGSERPVLGEIGLPARLSAENVVQTLISDVYARIPDPSLQDVYFAGVAKEVFSALATGKSDSGKLISGITRGVQENRLLIWSDDIAEQEVIARYPLSGAIDGPSISPAQFGVYFNDGTGAKMDFYVKRSVQLIKECPANGYEQTLVRIISTNTAPLDAAYSLPSYVTGDGRFGVPPGSVQTNIVAYGPVQSNVETVKVDGQQTSFAPYLHSGRPVGILAQRLAPGESRTVEFRFGKIVQHTEPILVVTPSAHPLKDVILPTAVVGCG
jgi:hypothetical protein